MKKFIISLLVLALIGFAFIKIGASFFGADFLSAVIGKEMPVTHKPATKGEAMILAMFSMVNGEIDTKSIEFIGTTRRYEGQNYCRKSEYSYYEGREIKTETLCPSPYFKIAERIYIYSKYDPYKAKPEALTYTVVDIRMIKSPNGAQRVKVNLSAYGEGGCKFVNHTTGKMTEESYLDMEVGVGLGQLLVCDKGRSGIKSIFVFGENFEFNPDWTELINADSFDKVNEQALQKFSERF